MAKLVIKGHTSRGEEVIEILKMLGGKTRYDKFEGHELSCGYYIKVDGYIGFKHYSLFDDTTIFTLEEFLEKYPYKVGDKVKVWVSGYRGVFNIQDMAWDSIAKEVKYKIRGYWLSAENLLPYKEENMEEKNNDNHIKWDLPVGYEFQDKEGNVINTDTIKLVKKQPQYPKTYGECCKVMGIDNENYLSIRNLFQDDGEEETTKYEQDLLDGLTYLWKLKICRDAYWKIAGEQMGLGKPWEPMFSNPFLNFPTEEMRDAFYENFKDLIEECKQFL